MCNDCIKFPKDFWKYMSIMVGFSVTAIAAVYFLEWLF